MWKRLKHGFKQGFLVIDQVGNWLMAPFSLDTWADETISSHCYRSRHKQPYKTLMAVIDTVLFWDRKGNKKHCELSYESEIKRRQSPPEHRDGNTTTKG